MEPERPQPVPATSTGNTPPLSEAESAARARWSWWRLTIIQVLVTWTIYILGIGPLYWQWFEGKHVGEPTLVAVFYEPLYQLAGLFPPLGWFLNWYISLWIV